MNGNKARWNEMIRNLVRSNPGELQLMDLDNTLRMTEHLALTEMLSILKPINELEEELRTADSLSWISSTGRGRVVLGLWHQKRVMFSRCY